jgi:hypothetical protein
MTDHDPLRSARDVDADAERFVDPDEDAPSDPVEPPLDGSIADVLDQHAEVPLDDEP